MPLFIDFHEDLPAPPPERQEGLRARINSGELDENGAKGVNVFFGKDGSTTCMFEAPNADAVQKAHEDAGVPMDSGPVREVTPLMV